jgi:hypothetical protein
VKVKKTKKAKNKTKNEQKKKARAPGIGSICLKDILTEFKSRF